MTANSNKQKITFYPNEALYAIIQSLPSQSRSAEITRRLVESFAKDGLHQQTIDTQSPNVSTPSVSTMPTVSTQPVDTYSPVSILGVDTQPTNVSTPDSDDLYSRVTSLEQHITTLMDLVDAQNQRIQPLEDASPVDRCVDSHSAESDVTPPCIELDELRQTQDEQREKLAGLCAEFNYCRDDVDSCVDDLSQCADLRALDPCEIQEVIDGYPGLVREVGRLTEVIDRLDIASFLNKHGGSVNHDLDIFVLPVEH